MTDKIHFRVCQWTEYESCTGEPSKKRLEKQFYKLGNWQSGVESLVFEIVGALFCLCFHQRRNCDCKVRLLCHHVRILCRAVPKMPCIFNRAGQRPTPHKTICGDFSNTLSLISVTSHGLLGLPILMFLTFSNGHFFKGCVHKRYMTTVHEYCWRSCRYWRGSTEWRLQRFSESLQTWIPYR